MGKLIAFFILFFLFFSPNYSLGQENIYDKEHSLEFVHYLFRTNQFELASKELERLIFLEGEEGNDSLKYLLLKSYRKSLNYEKAIERGLSLYSSPDLIPQKNAVELTENFILIDSLKGAEWFLNNASRVKEAEKYRLKLHLAMLQKNWCEADHLFNKAPNEEYVFQYRGLINHSLTREYRSPALALGLSIVIPGSGKIYTGDWEDGLFSFAGIGASAWQAYNGFQRDGIESVYGWIFASIGGVLYLSNIYGSFKSAKLFNKRHEDKIVDDTKPLLFHHSESE